MILPTLTNRAILIVLITFSSVFVFAQKNKGKSNWIQEKSEYTARWRAGLGVDIVEPTGVDVQFYRLSKICTGDFSITKKIAIGLYAGKEGLLTRSIIEKSNDKWEAGSFRYGIDLKFYIPIALNPYLGFGFEGGSRKIDNTNSFSPDILARIGIEQKILGVKLSTTSSLNITIFIDGKFNKSLTQQFSYIVPSCGFRFHFL